MNHDEWIKNIIEGLQLISDRNFQIRAWTGVGPEASSPGELIDDLFNGDLFEDYYEITKNALSDQEKLLIQRFIALVEGCAVGPGSAEEMMALIDSSDWKNLRVTASQVIEIIKKNK
jgi:hypothetical protein